MRKMRIANQHPGEAMHINLAWDRKSTWGLDGMVKAQIDGRMTYYHGMTKVNPVPEIQRSLRTQRASNISQTRPEGS